MSSIKCAPIQIQTAYNGTHNGLIYMIGLVEIKRDHIIQRSPTIVITIHIIFVIWITCVQCKRVRERAMRNQIEFFPNANQATISKRDAMQPIKSGTVHSTLLLETNHRLCHTGWSSPSENIVALFPLRNERFRNRTALIPANICIKVAWTLFDSI